MTCEYCVSAGGELLWRGPRCRIVLVAEPGFAGFCRVIWNDHVREMTDLESGARNVFMTAVFAAEEALLGVLAPTKINLASLGNQTPHLHWHVVPRFADDSHFPRSVWSEPLRPVPSRPWPKDGTEKIKNELIVRLGPSGE